MSSQIKSEVRSEFRVYSTNGYHEKTDYEKMHEIERMRALLIEHPEEFPNVQGGRMVERLAQVTAMKKTMVGGSEAPQKGNGCGRKWQSHKVYTRHPDNETDLVEFLKYVQKG